MTYGEAVLYGAVQGIAEYLPISSSAHLILLPKFLGQQDYGLAFDVFLHLGTLFATLLYFWRDWLGILQTLPGLVQRHSKKKAVGETISYKLIVVATIPALIAGAALHDLVESAFRGNLIQAIALVVGGALLWASDIFTRGTRPLRTATLRDALWVGIAQCFALVPGISRSGSTMTGGRLLGFDRASAARFSFLISAPITAAAIVFELRNWGELANGPVGTGPLVVAGLSSFLFGCLAIGFLLKMLRRFGYLSFAIYRVILAIVIIQYLGV